jgi:hypothetical protein
MEKPFLSFRTTAEGGGGWVGEESCSGSTQTQKMGRRAQPPLNVTFGLTDFLAKRRDRRDIFTVTIKQAERGRPADSYGIFCDVVITP